jgi:predicted DNA-binding transcriptional regulator AlpA
MYRKVFTTKQLAEYLSLSEALLNNLRAYGIGPVYMKIGRLVRYRIEDVDNWLAEQAEKNNSFH